MKLAAKRCCHSVSRNYSFLCFRGSTQNYCLNTFKTVLLLFKYLYKLIVILHMLFVLLGASRSSLKFDIIFSMGITFQSGCFHFNSPLLSALHTEWLSVVCVFVLFSYFICIAIKFFCPRFKIKLFKNAISYRSFLKFVSGSDYYCSFVLMFHWDHCLNFLFFKWSAL